MKPRNDRDIVAAAYDNPASHHFAALSSAEDMSITAGASTSTGLMIKHRETSGIALRMICAMLLVVLGFAHRPVMARQMTDPAMYVLPDGTLASLCMPGEDGRQDKHVDRGCEACRIASSATVPLPPLDAQAIDTDAAKVVFAFAPERFQRLNFPPNAPPRGPPALPVSFVTV